ncbi:MAG: hypothetical protein JXB47_04975 [Anaerolineae bacterium]|nr:hypothetical protein [Anaerolineae bacterium]
MSEEVDIIEPDEARAILDQAMAPYLEADWRLLDYDDYTAHLIKGARNLYIRVGWLGEVEVKEAALDATQTNGRLVAWVLLIAMLLVVFALAAALGLLP